MYLSLMLCGLLLYSLGNYLKSVVLAFRLDGPKALPLIGNVMTILEKRSKLSNTVNKIYESLYIVKHNRLNLKILI